MKKLKTTTPTIYLFPQRYPNIVKTVNTMILRSIFFFFFFENLILKRLKCIQCPSNEFTINQNENCEKCVEGGLCIDGILFNQAGDN